MNSSRRTLHRSFRLQPEGFQREWFQFRLLVRTSLGRLMDAALASRDTDATQFAIWGFALLATPPFFYAAKMFGKYHFLARRLDVLERVVVVDRLFFIVYAMLACALLAALLWDALFPDRQDQEIVGVLPVRPRTLAAARVVAALGVATVFAIAIAIPSGFIYTLNVAGAFRLASIVGSWFGAFIGHVVAMTMAGVFTFAVLLAVRGVAVFCVGAEAAQRAAAVLQLVTVVLLVETFIFLPTVLFGLVSTMTAARQALQWPPLWFLGVYTTTAAARIPGLASIAVSATAAAILLATVTYLVPATWNARRTLEARMKSHAGRAIPVAQMLASPALLRPASRAVFGFVLASLVRSRRHALLVATYLGVAVAVAGVSLMAATVRDRPLAIDAPADYLLALPLVITFLLVAGLRAAFAVPTDVDANWTFRVAEPRSTAPCVHAVGVALCALAVVPVTAVWMAATAFLWGWKAAMGAAVLHAASGVMLVELALVDCRAVPFTRAYAPASSGLRAGWALLIVALHVYAFRLADLQIVALRSAAGLAWYVGAMLAIAVAARVYRRSQRASWTLRFDAPVESATETLNLSQALG